MDITVVDYFCSQYIVKDGNILAMLDEKILEGAKQFGHIKDDHERFQREALHIWDSSSDAVRTMILETFSAWIGIPVKDICANPRKNIRPLAHRDVKRGVARPVKIRENPPPKVIRRDVQEFSSDGNSTDELSEDEDSEDRKRLEKNKQQVRQKNKKNQKDQKDQKDQNAIIHIKTMSRNTHRDIVRPIIDSIPGTISKDNANFITSNSEKSMPHLVIYKTVYNKVVNGGDCARMWTLVKSKQYDEAFDEGRAKRYFNSFNSYNRNRIKKCLIELVYYINNIMSYSKIYTDYPTFANYYDLITHVVLKGRKYCDEIVSNPDNIRPLIERGKYSPVLYLYLTR